MGITANMFVHGVTFGTRLFGVIVPVMVNAEILAPIFRELNLISVNEVSHFFHFNMLSFV